MAKTKGFDLTLRKFSIDLAKRESVIRAIVLAEFYELIKDAPNKRHNYSKGRYWVNITDALLLNRMNYMKTRAMLEVRFLLKEGWLLREGNKWAFSDKAIELMAFVGYDTNEITRIDE